MVDMPYGKSRVRQVNDMLHNAGEGWVVGLCMVGLILGVAGSWGVMAEGDQSWAQLKMGGAWARQWSFVGGEWSEDKAGVMKAPGNNAEQNLAFFTTRAYQDLEAEFEFRWDWVWTHAGFVFRAKDPQHYYLVFFPAVGQQYRAEHFWAAVAKVDERGYIEVLNMELVHGVTSAPKVWHQARVKVQGNEIRLWVDDRPLRPVYDDTYADAGYVGLATCTNFGTPDMSSFRNLQLRADVAPAPRFDPEPQPAVNYVIVDPAHGSGSGNLVRAPSGDVLVNSAGVVWHSADNGRTWTAGARLPSGASGWGAVWRIAPDGSLEAYWTTHEPPFVLSKAVSTDEGETWSEPRVVSNIEFPEDAPFAVLYPGRLLETEGGALLIFAYSGMPSETEILHGRYYRSLTPPVAWNVCLRSTDGGESWSAPINMDGPPHDDQRWMVWKEASEISVAQRADGKIMALIRPFRSPLMWETWSEDEGQTWTPVTRGPFPMYACNNSMTSTSSGALIIGGRFPGMGVQVSYDGGMTWRCYQVDTAGWSNGAMLEVEPDVVLWVYGGKGSPEQLRAQLIRITPDGIEPVD